MRKLPFLVFCLSITVASTLLWTTSREFFGEMHEAHTDPRTIHLKVGREYRQTFIPEGRAVTGVLVLVDKTTQSRAGTVRITADDGTKSTSTEVATSEIFPNGELYFSFETPLKVQKNSVVTLQFTSTVDVDLLYQIDGNIYKDGSLSLFVPSTNETKPVASDLAFQVRYKSPIADILHLTLIANVGIACIALAGFYLFSWLLHQKPLPSERFTFTWLRSDTWALLTALLIVGTIYGLSLFPNISWWSTNGDYVKDVIYLRSGVDVTGSQTYPSWQMNMCGGQPLLGNPEGNVLSFGTVFASIFGPVVGMKIFLWVELVVATAGAYILGRMLGLSPQAAIFPALVFSLNGFIPNRTQTATMFVAGAAAMPWMIITYFKSLHRPKWIIACALITVMAFLSGDTHVIIYSLLAIGCIGIVHAVQTRSLQPIVLLIILSLFLLLFGAIKLLPSAEGQSHYYGKQYPPLVVLLTKNKLLDDVFLSKDIAHAPAITKYGNPEGWNNIGLYTGILPLLLGVIGITVSPKHTRYILLAVIISFFVLGEGTFYDEVIRKLGGEIRSLFRIPSRSMIVGILALGLTGGYALDWIIRRNRIFGIGFCVIVLAIISLDLGTFTFSTLRAAVQVPPVDKTTQEELVLAAKPASHVSNTAHPFHILNSYALVGSTCPDFNKTPPFIRNAYDGPLVTSTSGNPDIQKISPSELRITPGTVPSVVDVHLVASPMLIVTGGIPRFLPDGSFQVLIPRTSQNVSVAYTSHLALPGLILTMGALVASLLVPASKASSSVVGNTKSE